MLTLCAVPFFVHQSGGFPRARVFIRFDPSHLEIGKQTDSPLWFSIVSTTPSPATVSIFVFAICVYSVNLRALILLPAVKRTVWWFLRRSSILQLENFYVNMINTVCLTYNLIYQNKTIISNEYHVWCSFCKWIQNVSMNISLKIDEEYSTDVRF